MVNFGPLTVEICWRAWGTPAISMGFASWLRYCTDVAERRSTKLCTMFGRLLHWYAIYTLLEALAPNVISSVQNSLCFQVLRGPTLAALLLLSLSSSSITILFTLKPCFPDSSDRRSGLATSLQRRQRAAFPSELGRTAID